MGRDNVPADGHAETGTMGLGGFDGFFKDTIECGRGQTAAIVRDSQYDASVGLGRSDGDQGCAGLQGVLDQVLQQTHDFIPDAIDHRSLGARHLDAIGAEKEDGLRVHRSLKQVQGINFTGMTGGLAPRLGEVQTERRAFLEGFRVVENALHAASGRRQLADLIKQHVGVADGDHEGIADVVDHLGSGLAEAGGHLLFLLVGLDRFVGGLELLEHRRALLAFKALGRVPTHGLLKHVDVERFLEIFVGAEANRGLGRGEGAIARHHDDGNLGIDLAHGLEALDAVFLRHADVHDNDRKVFVGEEVEAPIDAVHGHHLEFILEEIADALARTELIVDDQHLGPIGYGRSGLNGRSGFGHGDVDAR